MPVKGEKSLSVCNPGRVLPLQRFSVSLNTHFCRAWRVGDQQLLHLSNCLSITCRCLYFF